MLVKSLIINDKEGESLGLLATLVPRRYVITPYLIPNNKK